MFLTHDFKPVFESTLRGFDSSGESRAEGVVLFDADSPHYRDLSLGHIRVEMVRTQIASYDPLRPRKSHNLVIQYLVDKPSILDEYDYLWVLENDVYYHGGLRGFIDLHDRYPCDLLVPEYGLRHHDWCWLRGMRGVRTARPIGVTAVIHRMSRALAKFLVPRVADGSLKGMMEALLPHVCLENGYEIGQFIPDHVCSVSTFRCRFIDLIEKDILEGTERYIERKMYHPVKL